MWRSINTFVIYIKKFAHYVGLIIGRDNFFIIRNKLCTSY